MGSLIVAGEAVFVLPYYVTRFFRPTFLDVFGFTNTELGQAQAVYGVVAMVAYFPGGPLADRFSARGLLAASLALTAAGGLYMATIPSLLGMAMLWGFWGVTSILLLWAALIRATREWGGPEHQGSAFGILDGGRGLAGALMAAAAAQALGLLMPIDVDAATLAEQTEALKGVILMFSAGTFAAALVVWFGIPALEPSGVDPTKRGALRKHLLRTLKIPALWIQALIVIAAYISYKATDDFGQFAVDAYGVDQVEAASISSLSAWIRPVAAVFAGWLADRVLSSRVILGGFGVLMAGFASLALIDVRPTALWVFVAQLVIACIAIYGMRGVYFALFEQANVPTAVTGTAVGIVSVIGYTPDIFMGLVLGHFLDTYPGAQGHHLFFGFVAGAAAVGMIATVGFIRLVRRSRPAP